MSREDKPSHDEIAQLKKILTEKEEEIFRLKSIIDNVPGDVYWKNQEGVYTGISATGSESLRKMGFTWKQGDIIGKTDYDLYDKKTANTFRKNDLQIMKTGIESSKEEEAVLPSGERIVQLSTKRPLWNENGKIVGIVGNTIDITYLKNIEKDLRAAKEAAEKAHQSEEELRKVKYQLEGAKLISGSIAHEIRTPLATIKSTVCIIDNSLRAIIAERNITPQNVAEIKNELALINKKADQSNTIINMLLTKLQSIDFEFSEFSNCSASDCIKDALSEFPIPHEMRNKISFKKNDDFEFSGNRVLIMHVIMNLLKNALFFVQKAKKGEITIWLEQGETVNKIHFKDTGTGISKKILPHIFDSFFTTESSTGTGVGLAFIKMVMQSHKGSIDCVSEEGEYTEFILSFSRLDIQQS
jgi:two-component system aerobic respiration control sensor histidine kinase ArcB